MSIQRLHVEKRYSEVVIHNGTVYLAGQLADDYSADIQQQTRETLANIDRLLAEVGSDKRRILSMTIYLKEMADYDGLNAAFDAWVADGAAPSRACVQAEMYRPDVRVEITVVAAV
jgi:enamine deaminase RidA (YjgF/YER057c/UK114 family)